MRVQGFGRRDWGLGIRTYELPGTPVEMHKEGTPFRVCFGGWVVLAKPQTRFRSGVRALRVGSQAGKPFKVVWVRTVQVCLR